jgi:uncharacterized protein
MGLHDAWAFYMLGQMYCTGSHGLTRNVKRGLELYKQAAELGSCTAHYHIGVAYEYGQGVEKDTEKALSII